MPEFFYIAAHLAFYLTSVHDGQGLQIEIMAESSPNVAPQFLTVYEAKQSETSSIQNTDSWTIRCDNNNKRFAYKYRNPLKVLNFVIICGKILYSKLSSDLFENKKKKEDN